jgi:hypothetical protein
LIFALILKRKDGDAFLGDNGNGGGLEAIPTH